MGLSNDLISQFAKITKDKKETKKESTVYGTVVKYNGRDYVKMDGSELLTPVTSTADTENGDRVTVTIKNHTATVNGNLSSPSARIDTVKEQGSKIAEFDTIVSYKVTTQDLEAVNAVIERLEATVATIENADILNATIENLKAKYAEFDTISAEDMKVINAEIENLVATFGKFTNVSAETIEAFNADINNLKAYNANFTYLSAEVLEAVRASIKELDVGKLSATDATIKYATIDFSNIGEAAMKNFYANSGLIKDVTISNGTITGNLVGVTIKGDLIEGGTVVADKLVIKGQDGIYYKLNTDGETIESEQTEYNSLDGSHILAKSITATKVNVDDLVAFDATIGGFNITNNSIYSGVKKTIDNTTRGVYLDNNGQVAFGDANNFIRYYRDPYDKKYKIEIRASSIVLGSGKNIDTTIDEMQNNFDNIKIGARNLIRNSHTLIFEDYYFGAVAEMSVTNDDSGNVTIIYDLLTVTEDGEGNVTFDGVASYSDGNGNVTLME